MVEPDVVWIPFYHDGQAEQSDAAGNRYVRIGGGKSEGRFVFIGTEADKLHGDDNDQ